jgi:hypothetical protein
MATSQSTAKTSTAIKLPAKISQPQTPMVTPGAPATDVAIAQVAASLAPQATVASLATRTVRFTSALPLFTFREGGRVMEFKNGIYDATGDEILLLRHAAARAWWLDEITEA